MTGAKMKPKEKSLREILEDILRGFWTTPMKDLQIKWMDKALSAIQAHYKARRLSEEEILNILRSKLPEWELKRIFDSRTKYDDGTFPIQHIIKDAIFKKQEERDEI